LYTPLNEADDVIPVAEPDTEEPAAPTLYKVTGAGFSALPASEAVGELSDAGDSAGEPEANAAEAVPEVADVATTDTPDPDAVERVSRYNFDELSRILSDRVGERNRV